MCCWPFRLDQCLPFFQFATTEVTDFVRPCRWKEIRFPKRCDEDVPQRLQVPDGQGQDDECRLTLGIALGTHAAEFVECADPADVETIRVAEPQAEALATRERRERGLEGLIARGTCSISTTPRRTWPGRGGPKLQIFSSTDATNSRSGPPTASGDSLCVHPLGKDP
jgi:hypothetical protein